jgi:hypothetical protein
MNSLCLAITETKDIKPWGNSTLPIKNLSGQKTPNWIEKKCSLQLRIL